MKKALVLFRVALEVGALEKASEFYARLLDTKGRRVGGGRHYFDCGDVILALVDVSSVRKKSRPTAQNLYFAVSDLESVYARARALGGLSKEQVHGESGGALVTRPWGERSFYVEGPLRKQVVFCGQEDAFQR